MNISYHILGLDDTDICEEDLPNSRITIASAEVKLLEHLAEMPAWDEIIEYS